MDPKQTLIELRQSLTATQQTNDAAAAPVKLDQSCVGRLSRMDAMQAQAISLEGKRRREIQLRRIESALQRIEANEYGDCVQCDEAIDAARLAFDPTTLTCIACARRNEHSSPG